MGITSSLVTGLSGLSTSQTQIDVVGNNIANVNTVGFKSSRLDFKTQFLENFSYGTAPSADQGGTNPLQIGLGTQAGAISRNFGDGSLQVTGVATNMAVQGDGFFVLKDVNKQVYTRDGSFQLNGLNQLVSSSGQLVQGFGVDSSFNVVPGLLTNLTIPVGSSTVAQATTKATFKGNLDSKGSVPTSVTDYTLGQPLYLSDGAGGVDAVNPPTGTTNLTSITDSTGTAQFQVGDVVNFTGKKGTTTLAKQTFTVTSGSTLSDLQSFLTNAAGINTSAGANGSLSTVPGVTAPATGNTATLTLDGNPGLSNDLTLDANSLTVTRGTTTLSPYTFAKNSSANGGSVTTSMIVYDSLGTPINVNVTAVMDSKSSTGSTWRFYAEAPPSVSSTGVVSSNGADVIGMGTLSFDTGGHLLGSTNASFTLSRNGTGATPNLSVALDFSGMNGFAGDPAKADTDSSLASTVQDGSPPGSLTTFTLGGDGTINGSYSNGLSRVLGQIALATFRNDQGLVDAGSNTFIAGPNSGTAIITTPLSQSAGRVVSGSLELSNVDLSGEFVQLIAASTAFSASSRVITTSNQLLQDLLSAVH